MAPGPGSGLPPGYDVPTVHLPSAGTRLLPSSQEPTTSTEYNGLARHTENISEVCWSTQEMNEYDYDLDIFAASFEDKNDRMGFIQKVLAIKLLQAMTVTVFMISFEKAGERMWGNMPMYLDTRNQLLMWSALGLVAMLAMFLFYDKARFVTPYKHMILVAYPLSVAFFASVLIFAYGWFELLVSWIYFITVLFALLLYSVIASLTKIDFKATIGISISAIIFTSIYASTTPYLVTFMPVHPFDLFYFYLLMFALTAYMLLDIQIMMSKFYRIRLSPSDYVKAAVIMHTDYLYLSRFRRETVNALRASSALPGGGVVAPPPEYHQSNLDHKLTLV